MLSGVMVIGWGLMVRELNSEALESVQERAYCIYVRGGVIGRISGVKLWKFVLQLRASSEEGS